VDERRELGWEGRGVEIWGREEGERGGGGEWVEER
jgi:hypothetical protein